MQRVQQGSVGVALRARMIDQDGNPVDLTGAGTLSILARPPRGATKVFAATVVGDAPNGVLEYVTAAAGDLDSFGRWEFQPRAEWVGPPVVDLRGLAIQFDVVENLDG